MALFNERERAAENIYVHREEQRFLASHHALAALASWAAEGMGLSAEAGMSYSARLIDAFVAGTPKDKIVVRIQTDLERAGKPPYPRMSGR